MIVTRAPYHQRSARMELDVALAAATLEMPLALFFLGEGVWQLAAERNTTQARLPRGLKGWAALAQMTEVCYYAESEHLDSLRHHGGTTVVSAEAMTPGDMTALWRTCRRVFRL